MGLKKVKNFKIILLLTLAVLLTGAVPAFAAAPAFAATPASPETPATPASAADEALDVQRTGSVSVTLADGNNKISGAELKLYKVAEAGIVNGNLRYTFTGEFEDFGGEVNKLKSEEDSDSLLDYAQARNISGTALTTGEGGAVRFKNLLPGLYLIAQTGSVDGYSTCAPFLVAVPERENDRWIYDIDATPKVEVTSLSEITVKKVWNDDGKNRPQSVTVQLYDGKTVADTVNLSEENGWSYVWKNVPKSDNWSVKEIDVPEGYTPTYEKSGLTYTITNSTKLAQTGQLKWPIPALSAVGLLIFTCGWLMYFREKKHDKA